MAESNKGRNRIEKHLKHMRNEKLTKENIDRAFLISDSKGKYLKASLNESTHINIYSVGGAKIEHPVQRSRVRTKARTEYKPIFLFWFGTCEITTIFDHNNKYIKVIDKVAEKLTQLKEQYKVFQDIILTSNPRTTIIFLECPYYSIIDWNRNKGFIDPILPSTFSQQQTMLEQTIDTYNNNIRLLNTTYSSPIFSMDLTHTYRYGKNKKKTRKHIEYSMYLDGIHPNKELSELWTLRIRKLINKINV